MDLIGIEPMTSSMPWKRAPSCATGPLLSILSVEALRVNHRRRRRAAARLILHALPANLPSFSQTPPPLIFPISRCRHLPYSLRSRRLRHRTDRCAPYTVPVLFLVGAELDLSKIQERRTTALAITLGSVVLPFPLGSGLAAVLFPRFGTPNTSRIGCTLFVASP